MRSSYGLNGIYDVTVTRREDLIAEFRGRSHEMRGRRP
jgi:acyl-CoA thioesterase